MTEILSFPALGINLEINREAFRLPGFMGGWPIYWYGILIALGLLAGILYFFARTKEFAVDPDRATDVLLVAIICSIIGSRLYYVIFTWEEFRDNLVSVFFIRSGGLAIYGCVIGAFLSAAIMCKIRKVRFLPLLDLGVGGLLVGQAIGRWGNFTNMEAFGSNTDMPWGMTSPSITAYLQRNVEALAKIGVTVDSSAPVHPTFLYESLWCFLGFFLLMWYTKRRRFDGQLSLMYLGWYGLGRFFIEGLRTDSLLLGTIRVSQLLALLCFLASTALIILLLSKHRREGGAEFVKLYRDTEEGKLVLAGEFYKKSEKNGENEAVENSESEEVSDSGGEDDISAAEPANEEQEDEYGKID